MLSGRSHSAIAGMGDVESIIGDRPIAAGRILCRLCMKARGNEFASKVTEDGWRLFRKRTELAKSTLQDTAELSTKCPHWYYLMLGIATSEAGTIRKHGHCSNSRSF